MNWTFRFRFFIHLFVLPALKKNTNLSFDNIKSNSIQQWQQFWQKGGVVDFSGRHRCTCQWTGKDGSYCRNTLPKWIAVAITRRRKPALRITAGLAKPHMEMHWWHAVDFALWGHVEILEKQLNWYNRAAARAKAIAARQGYRGLRWQKWRITMAGKCPSIGAFFNMAATTLYFISPSFFTGKNQTCKPWINTGTCFGTPISWLRSPGMIPPNINMYWSKGVIAAQERLEKRKKHLIPRMNWCNWYWALQTAQQWKNVCICKE